MTDPSSKTLFQLSYPLFLQSLVMFAVMVADMMIWSAHSPQTAAALSVAGQVLRIALELSAVMGIGAVILISQSLGRGETDAARQIAGVACAANGVLGAGLGLLLALAGPLVLGPLSPDPQIGAEAATYLRLTGAGMAFLCFGNAAVACLRGFGHSRTVMLLGVLGAALYLALEYLLVLGPGPLPSLGVTGAGIANMATRIAVAVALVVVIRRMLRPRIEAVRAQMPLVRRMVALALPSVSDFIAYGFYQMILLGVIATQGEIAVLSRAYVMIAMSFLTLVIMALVQGTEVLIGYRLGRGDRAAVQAQGMRSSVIAAALSGVCALVIWLGSGPFIGLFTSDPQVHDLSRRLLFLTIFLQPCFAVNMILFHALRAVEDVRWPVLVSQILSWGFGLPLAWALCRWVGIEGVWIAFIVEELAKSLAMAWRWQRKGM